MNHHNTRPFDEDKHRDSTTINTDASELERTSPEEAVDLYHSARKNEIADATHQSQQYRLGTFTEWCAEEGIENMSELSGRTCYEYRLHLQEERGLKPYTIQSHMSTFRTFISFCERIEVAHGGLSDKILIPSVDADARTKDTFLDAEKASTVRQHLRKFEWASRDHTVFELLWSTGMRVGGLHALDLEDFHEDEQRLDLKHRPNRETPLKNGAGGERPVALSDVVTEVVADYIQYNRIDVTDDHKRIPLITSNRGRMSGSQLRNEVNYVTQPCATGPCPHGKNDQTCDYRTYSTSAQCPSSESPHDLRRGMITHLKSEDIPNEVIQDRANVSAKVLERSYDKRNPEQKMELRRQYLDELDL